MTAAIAVRGFPARACLFGLLLLFVTLLASVGLGSAGIAVSDALAAFAARVGIPVDVTSVPAYEQAIVCDLRLPRMLLASVVGAGLAVAGASYQAVFRNPLADPYLLGAAAGAGFAVTAATGAANAATGSPLMLSAAFAGALGGVALSYSVAMVGGVTRDASLVLAGVAVASFLTAAQTLLQQRNSEEVRQTFGWLLGRLSNAQWRDLWLTSLYIGVATAVLLTKRRILDVLAVGDEEARSLGLEPTRERIVVIIAASLATAAAVAVGGLIGFVGIIVPHTIRMLTAHSYRVVLPLSTIGGATFLAAADLAARLTLAPAEIPIGVVTALCGAPFFVLVLRRRSA